MTINNYFYFFSTVAQALAGLMAFVGIFVVLRLQVLDSALTRIYPEMDEGTTRRFNRSFLAGAELIITVKKILDEFRGNPLHTTGVAEIQALVDQYELIERQKQSIIQSFFGPVILMMVVMILCFAGICLVRDGITVVGHWVCVLVWIGIPVVMIWSLYFLYKALVYNGNKQI